MTKIWRMLTCWMMLCPCRPYDDGRGIGGQCIECGKIVGYMTDRELRLACEEDLKRMVRRG